MYDSNKNEDNCKNLIQQEFKKHDKKWKNENMLVLLYLQYRMIQIKNIYLSQKAETSRKVLKCSLARKQNIICADKDEGTVRSVGERKILNV